MPAVTLVRRFRMGRLLLMFGQANLWLTLVLVAAASISGLLLPGFTVATGALAEAVAAHTSVLPSLLALVALFFVARTLGPVAYETGYALWRHVDEYLNQRVMRAMAEPLGLSHIEDPLVLNKVAQAQGILTGWTPGQAAVRFNMVWQWRLQGILSLAIVFTYRWWAAAVMAVVATGLFQLARWYNDEVTAVVYDRTDGLRRAHYLRSLALSATAAKETRVFGLRDWLVDQYRTTWLGLMTDIWAKRREGWVLSLAVAAAVVVFQGGILVSIGRDAVAGTTGLATAVAAAQALLSVGVLWIYDDGHLAAAYADDALTRIEEMERAAAEVAGVSQQSVAAMLAAVPGQRLPARCIRFEKVTFTYPGRSEPVLDALTLEIAAGRSLAIVGENGAGKTTFVKLLAGLYAPTAGRITVDGVDLAGIRHEDWERHIAAVFQDFVCFELEAYDSVAFGALRNYDDRQGVVRAAEQAGAMGIVNRLADGWDTTLSRQFSGGTQLSGGEWQRLALARALFAIASGAGVLVLDEPTASLDVRGEAEVYQRFLELTRGVTSIVISHRFSTVRQADRIVVIEHGRVVEDGSHDQLVVAGGRYATMYQLQASRFSETEEEPANA